MLKWKVAKLFPNVAKKVAKASFYIKEICLKIAQTFMKCFMNVWATFVRYFCQAFSKIAQSGHTAGSKQSVNEDGSVEKRSETLRNMSQKCEDTFSRDAASIPGKGADSRRSRFQSSATFFCRKCASVCLHRRPRCRSARWRPWHWN